MAEAVTLDCIPLRKPAHPDVLVAIGGDDISLVWREQEGREHGGVSEDKGAIGRVLVRGEGATFGCASSVGRSSRRRFRCEGIAAGV